MVLIKTDNYIHQTPKVRYDDRMNFCHVFQEFIFQLSVPNSIFAVWQRVIDQLIFSEQNTTKENYILAKIAINIIVITFFFPCFQTGQSVQNLSRNIVENL